MSFASLYKLYSLPRSIKHLVGISLKLFSVHRSSWEELTSWHPWIFLCMNTENLSTYLVSLILLIRVKDAFFFFHCLRQQYKGSWIGFWWLKCMSLHFSEALMKGWIIFCLFVLFLMSDEWRHQILIVNSGEPQNICFRSIQLSLTFVDGTLRSDDLLTVYCLLQY